MTEFLDDCCLTLPESMDPLDETSSETQSRDCAVDDLVQSLLKDLPVQVQLPQCLFPFLNQLLYWVYANDFHNLRVRQTYQRSKYHFMTRKSQRCFSWENTHAQDPLVAQTDQSQINEATTTTKRSDMNASQGFSPAKVLDRLLIVLRSQHTVRYGALLDSPQIDLRTIVLEHFTHPHDFFDKGITADHEQLDSLGGDMRSHRPAIYIHQISEYRYVGQADLLARRVIKEHRSSMYRALNPSLHYWMWEQLPNAKHTWAVLAYVPTDMVPSEQQGLLMNLFEMLGSLLFQTLPSHALDTYLDPSITRTVFTKGLNVALPIYQNLNQGASIHHLARSKDPLLQQYYTNTLIRSTAARQTTMLSHSIIKYVDGVDVTLTPVVYANPNRVTTAVVAVRHVSREIFKQHLDALEIEWGDTVTVNVEVNPTTAHDFAFAQDAGREDPARRLAIRLTSQAGKFIYIHGKGDRQVWWANSLADEFEGVDEETSRRSERRWFKPVNKKNKFLNTAHWP